MGGEQKTNVSGLTTPRMSPGIWVCSFFGMQEHTSVMNLLLPIQSTFRLQGMSFNSAHVKYSEKVPTAQNHKSIFLQFCRNHNSNFMDGKTETKKINWHFKGFIFRSESKGHLIKIILTPRFMSLYYTVFTKFYKILKQVVTGI